MEETPKLLYPETIIGYDCREMWLPNVESWTEEERQQALLRQNIKRVLTVSKESWNSLFVFKRLMVDGRYVGAVPNAELEIPIEFEELQAGIWENLVAMQEFMNAHHSAFAEKPYWMIAITVVELPDYWDEIKNLFQSNPSTIDNQWSFLGYDVEDEPPSMWEGLVSYESNRASDYYGDLSEKIGKYLNTYHLYSEQTPAIEHCEWVTKKEHHPYWVYGLYLIKSYP
ncbi:MAG: hypothetical protein H0X30_30130 [Anaerolineae bacterium]|nr:hypothetical protein [Anaerolineae bacterium]